jgi:hypothetical protein
MDINDTDIDIADIDDTDIDAADIPQTLIVTSIKDDGSDGLTIEIHNGPRPKDAHPINIHYGNIIEGIANGDIDPTSHDAHIAAAKEELAKSILECVRPFSLPGFPYGLKDVYVAYPAGLCLDDIQELRNILGDTNKEMQFYQGEPLCSCD